MLNETCVFRAPFYWVCSFVRTGAFRWTFFCLDRLALDLESDAEAQVGLQRQEECHPSFKLQLRVLCTQQMRHLFSRWFRVITFISPFSHTYNDLSHVSFLRSRWDPKLFIGSYYRAWYEICERVGSPLHPAPHPASHLHIFTSLAARRGLVDIYQATSAPLAGIRCGVSWTEPCCNHTRRLC